MIFLFIQELILFSLAQLIGIFVALKSRTLIQGQNITIDFTAGEIIIFLILSIAFIYFLNRFSHKSRVFFRLVLGLVIFVGSQTVFSLFFGEVIVSTAVAVILAVSVLKVKIILLHNIGMILALAGIGAVLGLSLTPISVIFLLLVLSFYDIIAVYKTGHMVKLAEEMIRARAISGIVLPQKIKDWFENLEKVQPGGRFMILGSGDIVMPLILIASVISSYGLAEGLIVMLFSMFGLFLTYYLFITQKTRRPMAALPPIAVSSIIGYLVSVLI